MAEDYVREPVGRPCEPNECFAFVCNRGTNGCPFWHMELELAHLKGMEERNGSNSR